MTLSAHGVTQAGRRTSNEDALLVDVGRGLFVVADGMGGHRAGEVASGIAVDTIRVAMEDDGRTVSAERLREAVRRANAEILAAAADNAVYAGMGTTVTAALVRDSELAFVSVGDSRIYRWRNGVLTQLTKDDSWLSYARATGAEISEEDALVHPMRHVLTEVVGVRPELNPDLQVESLARGDTLILCSDGLHGVMSPDAVAAVLRQHPDPPTAARRLVEDAIERGSADNVTAIVVTRA